MTNNTQLAPNPQAAPTDITLRLHRICKTTEPEPRTMAEAMARTKLPKEVLDMVRHNRQNFAEHKIMTAICLLTYERMQITGVALRKVTGCGNKTVLKNKRYWRELLNDVLNCARKWTAEHYRRARTWLQKNSGRTDPPQSIKDEVEASWQGAEGFFVERFKAFRKLCTQFPEDTAVRADFHRKRRVRLPTERNDIRGTADVALLSDRSRESDAQRGLFLGDVVQNQNQAVGLDPFAACVGGYKYMYMQGTDIGDGGDVLGSNAPKVSFFASLLTQGSQLLTRLSSVPATVVASTQVSVERPERSEWRETVRNNRELRSNEHPSAAQIQSEVMMQQRSVSWSPKFPGDKPPINPFRGPEMSEREREKEATVEVMLPPHSPPPSKALTRVMPPPEPPSTPKPPKLPDRPVRNASSPEQTKDQFLDMKSKAEPMPAELRQEVQQLLDRFAKKEQKKATRVEQQADKSIPDEDWFKQNGDKVGFALARRGVRSKPLGYYR